MDRGRRDDRGHDYHEARRRPDARDRVPDRGQRDHHERRGDWVWGLRSSTDDDRGRGGAPWPLGGRQPETRYDSQAFQHQPRSEAMAVRNSSARRDGPQRRYDDPSLRRDEPQRRHLDEPSHYGPRDGILYDSGSRAQERRLPDSTASAAPTRRVGVPSSQELGRAPPAPKGAVDGRMLSGHEISKARSTHTSCFAFPQLTAQAWRNCGES